MKRFDQLNDSEIIALAISQEDEDARIYGEFALALKDNFPVSAAVFEKMQAEEIEHKERLTKIFKERFGEHIPLMRRGDVKGFVRRKPLWLVRPLGLKAARKYAAEMEEANSKFYAAAAERTADASTKKLLELLSDEEASHVIKADELIAEALTPEAKVIEEQAEKRLFLLQYVQPGLAGLMDGSVSTLAPLFAAAFATHNTWETFLVGLAASIGAGISMGFTEALSDDGVITGRGQPWLRGWVCGLMTTLGGLGHTLPYLIQNFWIATIVAIIFVVLELAVIAWIKHKYMESSLFSAAFQVGLGGALVFLAGILIGSA